jgi:hypothetical protein
MSFDLMDRPLYAANQNARHEEAEQAMRRPMPKTLALPETLPGSMPESEPGLPPVAEPDGPLPGPGLPTSPEPDTPPGEPSKPGDPISRGADDAKLAALRSAL